MHEQEAKNMKKKLKSQNIENGNYLFEASEIPTFDAACANEEDSVSLLERLEKAEQQLLVGKRQIIDTLVKWESMFDSIADKKRQLLECVEKGHLSRQQNSEGESSHKLFSIVTWGSSSMDGLVFTVMAENDAWAEELVRQWLNSNGRENHRIDKVMALVSRDVRGILNVGAKLLDV
jgi:hypothetical protein